MPIRRAASALLLAASLAVVPPVAAQDSTAVHLLVPIDIHGFVQIFYRAGDPLNKDGYRLRKADLKFNGSISPHIKWRVGFDAAKVLTLNTSQSEFGDSLALSGASIDQKSRILQDAALTYTASPALIVDVGQQVIPLGLEGTIPTSQIETIERTLFVNERSRAVGLGDVRDVGATVNGSLANVIEYHGGTFNEPGDDQGTTDANDQKVYMGRVAIHPTIVPGFQIGASGGYEGGTVAQHRERIGTEVQYRVSEFTLRAETMSARDGALNRIGWYGLGALRPTDRLQLVARFDSWDRDIGGETSINNALERQIVLGGSYLVDGSAAKLALNVVRQTFPNVTNVRSGTFLLVAFQGVW